MSKGVQIAIGAGLVALLLGWYGASNVATFTYFETLEEFQARGQVDRPARVHGYVVEGSIERDLALRAVHFAVQNDPPHAGAPGGDPLPVVYATLEVPDLFQGGAEVVVEGRLRADGSVFEATNVLAKCPSKFQAEDPPARSADAASF